MQSLDLNSLVSGRELQVDADAAVLAAVGDAAPGTGGHNVLVEGHVENGTGGIDIDNGMAGRASRADGSDVEDLDLAGSRGRSGQRIAAGSDDGSDGRANDKEAREEAHLENGLLRGEKLRNPESPSIVC